MHLFTCQAPQPVCSNTKTDPTRELRQDWIIYATFVGCTAATMYATGIVFNLRRTAKNCMVIPEQDGLKFNDCAIAGDK